MLIIIVLVIPFDQFRGRKGLISPTNNAHPRMLFLKKWFSKCIDPFMSIDLRRSPDWNTLDVWLCDIIEREGIDEDNDFIFQAKITSDGECHKTEGKGRCIFHNCMYDIQSFKEDTVCDSTLNFELKFGWNTKEQPMVPQGWTVQFKNLVRQSTGDRYCGTIETSWWSERDVTLINYSKLTDLEKQRYPDLVVPRGGYYMSRG